MTMAGHSGRAIAVIESGFRKQSNLVSPNNPRDFLNGCEHRVPIVRNVAIVNHVAR
jgi:hypothetical protein